jgi:uncharacterized protein
MLSVELARAVIDRVCQNALERGQQQFELTFHGGGEPVLGWTVLQEATAYARTKSLPCHVSMVSNGAWSVSQRDWILHHLDGLSLSFDGQPETQNRQRPFSSGLGSFRAVLPNIRALDRAGFPYGFRMTATAPWRRSLADDVRFVCTETGCQAMQVEPAFNARRGEHQGPTQAEAEAFAAGFLEAFEAAAQAGRQLTYSGARPWLLTRTFCTAPYGALIVNAAGKLVACYEITRDEHPLAEMSTVGRVVDAQVIVDEPARDALLGCLDKRNAQCRECFCYWHCAGDCYTRALTAGAGDAQSPSPRCAMNRQITAGILLWYIMSGDGVWRGQGACPQEAALWRTF